MSTLQEHLRAMQNKAAADAADRLDELEREVEALPHHPEPHTMRWTALEEAAICKAQADAARAALEQAARICDEFQRQHGDSDNHGKVMALRIRTLAKGITP